MKSFKWLIFLCVCVVSFSCQCIKYCVNPPEAETIIEYRDTVIKGAEIFTEVPIEVLQKDTIYIPGKKYPMRILKVVEDTLSRAKLTLLQNEHGQLIAKCEAKDRLLKKFSEKETEVITVTEAKIPWYIWLVMGVLLLVILLVALK